MTVEIDKDSGFCFGVVTAIESAERELRQGGTLYCLGDIVHNSLEVERLRRLGLRTVNHHEFSLLRDVKVLLRAHGEPPETYAIAKRNNITVIDATCPVVLRLQRKIHTCHTATVASGAQLLIYGKKGHAEVNGLVGQTAGAAIVVESPADLLHLDYTRPIALFSQTTMPPAGFRLMTEEIQRHLASAEGDTLHSSLLTIHYSICHQVANRLEKIQAFAARHDRIYFVAGEKSSNGRMLFDECRKANPNTLLISTLTDLTDLTTLPPPDDVNSIGICGATSTPKWLMERLRKQLNHFDPANRTIEK